MHDVTFCQYTIWNPSDFYSNPHALNKMIPYKPDNTSGTLTLKVGKNFTYGYNINTIILYQIPVLFFLIT